MLVASKLTLLPTKDVIAEDVQSPDKIYKKYYFYAPLKQIDMKEAITPHRLHRFYTYMIMHIQRKDFDLHFYNVYLSNYMKCKFYIDYDMQISDCDDYKGLLLETVDKLKFYINSLLGEQIFHISASIYNNKISIHIITDKVFDNAKQIKELLTANPYKGVDLHVYKEKQLFRTVFSAKIDKGKHLWPIDHIINTDSLDESTLMQECKYTDDQIYELLANDCPFILK